MMMSEDDYQQRMDRIVHARQQRDEAIEDAQGRLTDEIVEAYQAGLTLQDINHATGLSVTTIRSRLKSAASSLAAEREA